MSLTGLTLNYGILFDYEGKYLDTQWFSKHAKNFKYQDGSYIVDIRCKTHFILKDFLWNKKYFLYNIDNPSPIQLDNKRTELLNSQELQILLETNTAKKLNDLSKKGLLDMLDFKTILIIIAVLGVGYYLLSGNKII